MEIACNFVVQWKKSHKVTSAKLNSTTTLRSTMERPDLSNVDPQILAYIEYLESSATKSKKSTPAPALEPSEPPTTMQVITLTQHDVAKRTARHLYGRQRRAGMGIFDIDTDENDPPKLLTVADEASTLIVVTSQAKAYRLPVAEIASAEVRARGASMRDLLPMLDDEIVVALVPEGPGAYFTVVSERGFVRSLPKHLVSDRMQPGMVLYNMREGGPAAAACRNNGDESLFIATREAKAIRFAARNVPAFGTQGLRLTSEDKVISVTPCGPKEGVMLLAEDGKGTIRLMTGFAANKAPGAGGKVALKAERLVGAMRAGDKDDIFIISRQSKLIRFQGAEIPQKEGVVQGVNCMALRSDECVAFTVTSVPPATE